jgi:cytochrome c oxidase assembly protein subunit 15
MEAVSSILADQQAGTSTPPAQAAPRWLRRIFLANLVGQIAIVATGGLVRLTGSGLGCPTWPECVDGSIAPTQHQAESWQKYVEFGNRVFSIVVGLLAVAAVIGVWRWTRSQRAAGLRARRSLVLLTLAVLGGTLAQGVLGGITVLTGLHPATVAGHFLLSVAIIAAATVLLQRAGEDGDRPVAVVVRPQLRALAWTLVALALAVIVIGTIVTGSGPHAGDADVDVRFPFDQRLVAWLHADVVLLFVGLQIGLLVAISLTQAPRALRVRAVQLLAVTVVNGVVGYSQLATGLPWLLVVIHMLLACLLWVAVLRVALATRVRGTAALDPAAGPVAPVR